nr:MAG TPA: hypothetical protein [Caudoviricetes sp.]
MYIQNIAVQLYFIYYIWYTLTNIFDIIRTYLRRDSAS